jgi:membrane-associated phospholipid phosphatase
VSFVSQASRPLPVALRRPLAVIAVCAAVVVAVLGVRFAGQSVPTSLEAPLLPPIEGVQGTLYYVSHFFDFFGEPIGSVLLELAFVAVCLRLRRLRIALLAVVGALLTVGLEALLKPLVDRTIHGGYLSFPSGHTAFATSLALVVALLVVDLRRFTRRTAVLLVLAAALVAGAVMGWAEVAVGAHYPADTLGGFCLALAVVPFAGWAIDLVFSRWVRHQ